LENQTINVYVFGKVMTGDEFPYLGIATATVWTLLAIVMVVGSLV
jgi:hypothetical protein